MRFFGFNPLLGLLCLYDEVRGERRFGLQTTGVEKPRTDRPNAAVRYAYSYMPVNFVLMDRLLNEMKRHAHNGTFLDLGCGKGRAMILAAHAGFEQVAGVELMETHCADARRQIEKHQPALPAVRFAVHAGDAALFPVHPSTEVFFLYNPFRAPVMERVISNIEASLRQYPRTIYILYANPLLKHLFLSEGYNEVYHTSRFNYMHGCILKKTNPSPDRQPPSV